MCLDVMLLLIYIQGVPSDQSGAKQCMTKPTAYLTSKEEKDS